MTDSFTKIFWFVIYNNHKWGVSEIEVICVKIYRNKHYLLRVNEYDTYSYFAVCNGRHKALRYSNSLLKYKMYEINILVVTPCKYVCQVKSKEVNWCVNSSCYFLMWWDIRNCLNCSFVFGFWEVYKQVSKAILVYFGFVLFRSVIGSLNQWKAKPTPIAIHRDLALTRLLPTPYIYRFWLAHCVACVCWVFPE